MHCPERQGRKRRKLEMFRAEDHHKYCTCPCGKMVGSDTGIPTKLGNRTNYLLWFGCSSRDISKNSSKYDLTSYQLDHAIRILKDDKNQTVPNARAHDCLSIKQYREWMQNETIRQKIQTRICYCDKIAKVKLPYPSQNCIQRTWEKLCLMHNSSTSIKERGYFISVDALPTSVVSTKAKPLSRWKEQHSGFWKYLMHRSIPPHEVLGDSETRKIQEKQHMLHRTHAYEPPTNASVCVYRYAFLRVLHMQTNI